MGGFWRIFGFVEISVLGLLMVSNSWLNILWMYILPILWLRAGLVLLMWIASLASLQTCLLSWTMILKCKISALGWLWADLCWKMVLVVKVLCSLNLLSKQHTSTSSTIYQHGSTYNHPKADISHFKIIVQDSKQVCREARKAIHMRRTNPALNHNIGKMYIHNIFNISTIFNQLIN